MQDPNTKEKKEKYIRISTKDAKHAKYALPDSYNDDVYDDNPSLSGITAYDTLDNKESQPSQGYITREGRLDHHTTLADTYKLNDHQTLCKCTGAGTAKTEETGAAGEAKEEKEATVAKVVKVAKEIQGAPPEGQTVCDPAEGVNKTKPKPPPNKGGPAAKIKLRDRSPKEITHSHLILKENTGAQSGRPISTPSRITTDKNVHSLLQQSKLRAQSPGKLQLHLQRGQLQRGKGI